MQAFILILFAIPFFIGIQIGKNVYNPKSIDILKGMGYVSIFLFFALIGKGGMLSVILILCGIFYLAGINIGEKEF